MLHAAAAAVAMSTLSLSLSRWSDWCLVRSDSVLAGHIGVAGPSSLRRFSLGENYRRLGYSLHVVKDHYTPAHNLPPLPRPHLWPHLHVSCRIYTKLGTSRLDVFFFNVINTRYCVCAFAFMKCLYVRFLLHTVTFRCNMSETCRSFALFNEWNTRMNLYGILEHVAHLPIPLQRRRYWSRQIFWVKFCFYILLIMMFISCFVLCESHTISMRLVRIRPKELHLAILAEYFAQYFY